ncbi:uncharacterized protein METZ01_LOCUS322838, partial [marine metagenome]
HVWFNRDHVLRSRGLLRFSWDPPFSARLGCRTYCRCSGRVQCGLYLQVTYWL